MRIDILGVGFDNLTMTEAVARGYDSVVSHEQHGAGTFYLVVYVLDALL